MFLYLSEAYVDECQRVWAQHRTTPWRMGDLVVEGLAEYTTGPQTRALFLEQLAAQLECSPKTLANYARVSEGFPPDARFEALELGHHEVVLKLEPEQRTEMLTRAAEGMWTVARLRREVADERVPEPDELTAEEIEGILAEQSLPLVEWGKRKVLLYTLAGDIISISSNSPLRWRKEVKHED